LRRVQVGGGAARHRFKTLFTARSEESPRRHVLLAHEGREAVQEACAGRKSPVAQRSFSSRRSRTPDSNSDPVTVTLESFLGAIIDAAVTVVADDRRPVQHDGYANADRQTRDPTQRRIRADGIMTPQNPWLGAAALIDSVRCADVTATEIQIGALQPIFPAALEAARDALPNDEILVGVVAAFRALGDPTRARILYALTRGPLCVRDLAILVGVLESAVSHQLRLLRERRLVKSRRLGTVISYTLDDHHLAALFREAEYHADHVRQQLVDHPYT
jgi:ArsR family transcriptional regulator, lead/cadmium/zinc/bismuth-responsive transcriptional repressor